MLPRDYFDGVCLITDVAEYYKAVPKLLVYDVEGGGVINEF